MIKDVLLGHVSFEHATREFWCIECADPPDHTGHILSQDLEFFHGMKTGTLHPSEFELTLRDVEAMLYPLNCARCSCRFYVTDDEVTGYWYGMGFGDWPEVIGDDE